MFDNNNCIWIFVHYNVSTIFLISSVLSLSLVACCCHLHLISSVQGYFQLKADPGAWILNLRNGKSKDIYNIVR